MGTATLRLGLASLTDTNTSRDASCEMAGASAEASDQGGSRVSFIPPWRTHKLATSLLSHGSALTMSLGVTPSPLDEAIAGALPASAPGLVHLTDDMLFSLCAEVWRTRQQESARRPVL